MREIFLNKPFLVLFCFYLILEINFIRKVFLTAFILFFDLFCCQVQSLYHEIV